MLGKLDWSAIPFDQPIPLVVSIIVILVNLGVDLTYGFLNPRIRR